MLPCRIELAVPESLTLLPLALSVKVDTAVQAPYLASLSPRDPSAHLTSTVLMVVS